MAGPAPSGAWSVRDTQRLFDVESSAPIDSPSTSGAPAAGHSQQQPLRQPDFSGGGPAAFGGAASNTLDEPLWDTIARDVKRIYLNLKLVVFPFGGDREQQSHALRNWDLWGPMTFTLVLAACLSVGYDPPSTCFSVVFSMVSLGSLVLTLNVSLIGGNIGFFQALCLLGYCLFPIDVAAIVSVAVRSSLVRWLVTVPAVIWAAWAAVPFIGGSVPPERRALAVYPLLLLYTSLGWLALVR